MNKIHIIENNIDVREIQQELSANNNNWSKHLQLVKQNKIHALPNRSSTEKDVILIGGPYKIGIDAEQHTFNEWERLKDIYDNPKVEFRKTVFFDDYPLLMNFLYSKFPSLKTELARIIISKLYPGDKVVKHYDTGRAYRKNRFHFSLQGTYKYYVADTEITVEAGTLFWFDNKQLHWAENIGTTDRITVIFDIDPIHCESFNLPVNEHRYLNNKEKNGRYHCNDIDDKTALFLHND